MFYRIISLVTFISIFSFTSLHAQEIGQIFTKEEANIKFGKVLESKPVSTLTVANWLSSTGDKIMFQLKDNNINALGDSRELLYSTSNYSENNEVFHMYSRSKVVELIDKGRQAITYFENRENVFSITNGGYTLEYSMGCPPYCP